ncbi:MAG: hypothetical protein ACRCU5_02480 [Rhizobiaceae bacterium]
MASVNIVRHPHTSPAARQLEEMRGHDQGFIVVRRHGAPPLRFNGELLFSETSYRSGPSLWYEINLYRRAKAGYVLETKCFKKDSEHKDILRAEQCASIGDVIRFIENYDTRGDVDASLDVVSKMATADLVLNAVVLRQKLDEAASEYGDVAMLLLETLVEFDPAN